MEERLLELITLEIQESLTQEEQQELEVLMRQYPEYKSMIAQLLPSPEYRDELLIAGTMKTDRAWEQVREKSRRRKTKKLYGWWGSVAAIALLLVGFFYWEGREQEKQVPSLTTQKYGIKKAILELADGETITLDKTLPLKRKEAGREILLTDSMLLVYKQNPVLRDVKGEEYHKIYVPRGCEFSLTLADGSKVWMNSDSRLKYPAVFTGNRRTVYLEGEAYFEIAKDTGRPFIVNTEQMEIEVTGTSFNVMAYPSEPVVQTTLITGQVNVSAMDADGEKQRYAMVPGEQCSLTKASGQMSVEKVNTGAYTAWKDGSFFFDGETVETLMRKIARWYDVEVVYENEDIKSELFYGTITRYGEVAQVLDMLVLTKTIHYEIKEQKIYIRK